MGGFSPRHARAFHNLGLVTGGSRLARRPQRLPEPDIRPDICVTPPPLTIHDTFDRGSYSPAPQINSSPSTSGHTWTNYRGIHRIGQLAETGGGPLNSVAYCTAQSLSNAAVAGFDYGTTDVHLAVRQAGGSGDSSRGLAICFNGLAPGSSSQYALNMDGLALTRTVGASVTTLATDLDPPVGGVVEVIKSGGDFEVYVNGALRYTVNDPSPLAGTICGLFTRFDQSSPGPDSFYDFGYPYNPCDPEAFV